MSKNKDKERIADFLFELGTMRKLLRSHRQTLLTDDMSDNIASHSYRVAMIGWVLANEEKVDSGKVAKMCLLHDTGEARTGDHNYVHKRYVKEFSSEVIKEQLGTLPHPDFKEIALEYEERKSKEAIVAKDADMLDQMLLLREYSWLGNKEAERWLKGKGKEKENSQYKQLKTKSAKDIAKAIMKREPSEWWNNLWTAKNR